MNNEVYQEAILYLENNAKGKQAQSYKYHLDQIKFQEQNLEYLKEDISLSYKIKREIFLQKQRDELIKFEELWSQKAKIKENKAIAETTTKINYSKNQLIYLANTIKEATNV